MTKVPRVVMMTNSQRKRRSTTRAMNCQSPVIWGGGGVQQKQWVSILPVYLCSVAVVPFLTESSVSCFFSCSAMYVTASMADFRLGGRIRQRLSEWASRCSCTVLSHLKSNVEKMHYIFTTKSSPCAEGHVPGVTSLCHFVGSTEKVWFQQIIIIIITAQPLCDIGEWDSRI